MARLRLDESGACGGFTFDFARETHASVFMKIARDCSNLGGST